MRLSSIRYTAVLALFSGALSAVPFAHAADGIDPAIIELFGAGLSVPAAPPPPPPESGPVGFQIDLAPGLQLPPNPEPPPPQVPVGFQFNLLPPVEAEPNPALTPEQFEELLALLAQLGDVELAQRLLNLLGIDFTVTLQNVNDVLDFLLNFGAGLEDLPVAPPTATIPPVDGFQSLDPYRQLQIQLLLIQSGIIDPKPGLNNDPVFQSYIRQLLEDSRGVLQTP